MRGQAFEGKIGREVEFRQGNVIIKGMLENGGEFVFTVPEASFKPEGKTAGRKVTIAVTEK